MSNYLVAISDLAAAIYGNTVGRLYGYRTQQRVGFFWNKAFSYANARYFKRFGKGTTIARTVVLVNPRYVEIGDYSWIGDRSVISAWDKYENEHFNPTISIGTNTRIGADCHITSILEIVIGNGVLLGNKITITDNAHGPCTLDQMDIAPIKRRLVSKGAVVIEDHVWVGDKASILPGVRVGRGAIVAANAVVACDVPEGCVVAGVPAKIVKDMSK